MAGLLSNPPILSNRRALLGAMLCLPFAARAEAAQGFVIDWQGGGMDAAIAQSLAVQIALVEALPISAEAMAFFRAQPIAVDREMGARTRAGPRGVFFARREQPAANPVLLHELIHRWQLLRMPGGRANPDVLRLYAQDRAGGRYPAAAYMLTNPFEYFAMMASVVLHGEAARPPFKRANVETRSPETYALIVREFGLRI
ncbi:hypothetical protein [Sphingomonas sp.]|uniref:hypothetical protein n=1 Tax=Sphingomonas sp. TaxID=28214 RepID=UPI001EC36724|nr:hypothetical protein [Sphingomonas sp.]MBX3594869.1 hypothetical protein [Sphingomonas sp.]